MFLGLLYTNVFQLADHPPRRFHVAGSRQSGVWLRIAVRSKIRRSGPTNYLPRQLGRIAGLNFATPIPTSAKTKREVLRD